MQAPERSSLDTTVSRGFQDGSRGPPLIRLESLVRPLYRATSALALASALGLSGCGGGASSASSAPATAPPPPPSKVLGCASGGSSSVSSTPVPAPTFFLLAANDGVSGPELWKSDGTEAGTVRVKDINPSPGAGSSPRGLTVFNNALYFSASDGSTGVELWKTDGTEGGTERVKDIAPGVGSIGGILEPLSSSPSGFTVFNNALYFSADDGVSGRELWKTDGTEGGTALVKDINPTADSSPSGLKVFGNALYFSADDGATGRRNTRRCRTPSNRKE